MKILNIIRLRIRKEVYMDKIRWGIIGTGKIARTFAEAINGTEDAELYAVASRTAEKAEKFAKENGSLKAYGSYRELAEDENVDVVYIATPMASHYDDALLCIEKGRNVLCEKSLSLNTEMTKEIIDRAKEKNVFFMEAMWMKCRPVYLKVLEWINSGKIGRPNFIKADFSNYIPYDKNDRLFRADCGGGALLDLGVYPLTFAHAIFGYPDEIISEAEISSDGVDINNTILLKYSDGRFVSADNGFRLQLSNNSMVSGTEGFITLGNWFHCTSEALLYDNNAQVTEKFICEPEINGYEYEIREVHECLRKDLKESALVPHEGTIEIMKIMDECRKQWGMKFPQEK